MLPTSSSWSPQHAWKFGREKSQHGTQETLVPLFSQRHPTWPCVQHLQAQCIFAHLNHTKQDFKTLHLHLNSLTNLAFDLSSYIRIIKSAQGSTSARNPPPWLFLRFKHCPALALDEHCGVLPSVTSGTGRRVGWLAHTPPLPLWATWTRSLSQSLRNLRTKLQQGEQ